MSIEIYLIKMNLGVTTSQLNIAYSYADTAYLLTFSHSSIHSE